MATMHDGASVYADAHYGITVVDVRKVGGIVWFADGTEVRDRAIQLYSDGGLDAVRKEIELNILDD